MLIAAISPFVINIFSGIILTVRNRFSDTPKFDIGAVFAWSQLPASGSIFPVSVLVGKSLTACKFIDISTKNNLGRFSIAKFRWMIASAALVGFIDNNKVQKLIAKHKKQMTGGFDVD